MAVATRVVVLALAALVALLARARGDALGALGALEALLPSVLLDNVEDLVRAASAACELVPLELLEGRRAGAEALPVLEYRRGGGVRVLRGGPRRARGPLPLYVPGWGNSPTDAAARALPLYVPGWGNSPTDAAARALPLYVPGWGNSPTDAAARALPLYVPGWGNSPTDAAARALPLYVPGWGNSPTDAAARALVGALLRHHPAVLVLDTRRAFARPYLAAAARVGGVARALAALLRRLGAGGVAPADVHVIGFSLGAHAAGAAGRLLAAPPGRITALDPARPCFTRSRRALRRSDAAFVQVIHSSAGVLGLEAPLGHADVYVNGVARRQPECAARGGAGLECDHNAAWRVFAASARDSRALPARRCASWRELAHAACGGRAALLGYPCDSSARGMFLYMNTTAA